MVPEVFVEEEVKVFKRKLKDYRTGRKMKIELFACVKVKDGEFFEYYRTVISEKLNRNGWHVWTNMLECDLGALIHNYMTSVRYFTMSAECYDYIEYHLPKR